MINIEILLLAIITQLVCINWNLYRNRKDLITLITGGDDHEAD